MALMPQKKFYRQRAHSNPMSDHSFVYPVNPDQANWAQYYPQLLGLDNINEETEKDNTVDSDKDNIKHKKVEIADIGCGYGGLLIELSRMYPDTLMVGMEIRVKVSDYVMDRIAALRLKHPGSYQNIACIRTNAMKYLPNYFHKAQLSKLFFLFPDPHFKRTKHKWRIISPTLLAEYAYILKIGGIIYTATDVEELHKWMVQHISQHPLFQRLDKHEEEADEVSRVMVECTEEGKKVARCGGRKWLALFKRVQDPAL